MQPNLLDVQPRFDGPADTLTPADQVRLANYLHRVIAFMADGKLHTLKDVAEAVGCSESGAGARLRDLRKKKFGAFTVDRIRSGNSWLYRVKP